jgi:hypothetical protein
MRHHSARVPGKYYRPFSLPMRSVFRVRPVVRHSSSRASAICIYPRRSAHTKAQHHKSKFALRAAAMLHGGVDSRLLGEVQWWRTDDLWCWSLEALVV